MQSATINHRYKSLFSYYGGKSKVVHHYPAPMFDIVIEPFAGAAGYSTRYCEKTVRLGDLNPRVAKIWDFLLTPDALSVIELLCPPTVVAGDRVSNILPEGSPEGLVELLRAAANQGTQGGRGVHDQITKFGAIVWPRIIPKMRALLPLVSHWEFRYQSYEAWPNYEATWFIDPPYNNSAGRRYVRGSDQIDFTRLAEWCRSRNGQVIVCENEGADWLPFRPVASYSGIRGRYQKSRANEVMWTNL